MNRLNCYDVMELVSELGEPLSLITTIDHWQNRLLLELKVGPTAAIPVENPCCSCKLTRVRSRCVKVGLKSNRRTTFVSFGNALMACCVLLLSHKCLPYELQVSHGLQLQSPWRIPAAAVS